MSDLPSNTLTNVITKFEPTAEGNESDGWFNYPVRVYPHHTDYAGVVWHGTYLTHVTQKPKKVSETAIPSEIAAKP
jgi:hypothetical protein